MTSNNLMSFQNNYFRLYTYKRGLQFLKSISLVGSQSNCYNDAAIVQFFLVPIFIFFRLSSNTARHLWHIFLIIYQSLFFLLLWKCRSRVCGFHSNKVALGHLAQELVATGCGHMTEFSVEYGRAVGSLI